MDCLTCREALSARIDAEGEPVPAEQTDQHVASCTPCRSWQTRAALLTRTLRVRRAPAVPDLADTILEEAVPPPSVRGWWARIALIGVAAAQVGLALSQMLGIGTTARHGAAHAGDPGVAHLFNENTAWNLALGVGLLWAAFRSRVTTGLLPVLGGYVLLLVFYSAHDLSVGAVAVARVVEHGLLVLALGLLVVLNRGYGDPAPQRGAALDDTAHVVVGSAEVTDPERAGGGTSRRRWLRPAGRHHAA